MIIAVLWSNRHKRRADAPPISPRGWQCLGVRAVRARAALAVLIFVFVIGIGLFGQHEPADAIGSLREWFEDSIERGPSNSASFLRSRIEVFDRTKATKSASALFNRVDSGF